MNQLYLYVALIGVALVLFALTRTKQMPLPQTQPPANSQVVADQEMKELIESFMNDLERDHHTLLEKFTQLSIEQKQRAAEREDSIRSLEARVEELEAMLAASAGAKAVPAQGVPHLQAVVPPLAATSSSRTEGQERPAFTANDKYAPVLDFARHGYTPEQIARETGIGIGEIMLVIELAKRGED
ncbi:DUF6115 domain-containing protein [Tumebacillus lipolyticus]|uniref:DUF6115 domain-containing protein n=1 Tax=Tumebacillus lipolyticus TaxID=1280370 RepID=A0ABW5A152_9BACL